MSASPVYRDCPECASERLMTHESASYFVRWVECSDCGWRSPLNKFQED
jgi:hypothetical protein